MFAKVLWISVIIIVAFCVYTSAQDISAVCLGCICEVVSGCNTSFGCDGPICGPFYITKQYWVDAGKPVLISKPNNEDEDHTYRNCVNDAYCAADTVQNYMSKFRRDCTGNGVINCDDYVRIHRFGASGCTNSLHSVYETIYKQCIESYNKSLIKNTKQ